MKQLIYSFIFIIIIGAVSSSAIAQFGAIEGEPPSCDIYLTHDTCSSLIKWFTYSTTYVEIWVVVPAGSANESLFASSVNTGWHSQTANWIAENTLYEFRLYDYSSGGRGVLLASAIVQGERVLRCVPLP